MERHSLLQIATRIHYALLREIGTGIDIGAMLRQQGYAREVIYLCRACSDPEIRALGEHFESLTPEDPPFAHAMQRSRRTLHRVSQRSPRQVGAPRRHPRDFPFTGLTKPAATASGVRASATHSQSVWYGRELFKLAH
ncbi:hypothetical protein BH09PSE5_BH09PSE5_18470 [soil metagenome]